MRCELEGYEGAKLQEDGEEKNLVNEMSTATSLPTHLTLLPFPHKRKVNKHETMALGGECSVVVHNKLSTMLKDLGSFCIHNLIGNVSIDRALRDLG